MKEKRSLMYNNYKNIKCSLFFYYYWFICWIDLSSLLQKMVKKDHLKLPNDIQCLITSDKHTETSDFNNYHRYISNQPPTQWSLQNYSSVLLSIGNLGRNDFRGWPIIDIWEPKNSDINISADNIYYLYLHILKPFLQWSSNCGFQTIMMIIYSLRINFIVHNDINALKL